MAEHFSYYNNWRSAILTCAKCGWHGTFEQGAVDYFEELMDSSCPTCDTILATVTHPTDDETEANLDKLTDEDRRSYAARKQFLATWEAACLKSATQLPNLKGSALTLVWDMVGWGQKRKWKYTVLRHGKQEIWREPALWEGYQRFQEIVELLITKYGRRLYDVVPTDASMTYLYGDKFSASDFVERIRESLRTPQQI